MSKRCRFCFAIVVCLIVAGSSSATAQELNSEEFKELHKQLNPSDETWKSIPWETSLLEAQRKAATEEKLIFIWAMDGHPLGCT